MGVVIGVVIGYALGSRAGPGAWTEFEEAWKSILSSEQVQDLVSGGWSLARDLMARRAGFPAGAFGGTSDSGPFRSAA